MKAKTMMNYFCRWINFFENSSPIELMILDIKEKEKEENLNNKLK